MFGFLAVKYHRSFPNSKVIVKGCIPMHTQCAYGTCWPAFEHLATWILWRLSCSCNCQSFLKCMTTGLLSLGGTVWHCPLKMCLRNSCLSMRGNGHSNHWMALCWPLCALATFLEHLAKQMVMVCECVWHGMAPCVSPGKPLLAPR